MTESLLQELEVLKSIYCGPDEFTFCCEDLNDESITQLSASAAWQLRTECQFKDCDAATVVVAFSFSSDYPQVPPEITLNRLSDAKAAVDEFARSLIGRPMMLDLMIKIRDSIFTSLSTSDSCCCCCKTRRRSSSCDDNSPPCPRPTSSVVVEEKRCDDERRWIALLRLDHMRSKTSYVKTLHRWSKDLNLTGRILFHERLILLVLEGRDQQSLKDFVVQLRTSKVDIDSHGRSCKERMLSVLAEPHLKTDNRHSGFETFSVLDLSVWKDVENFFVEHCLETIYNDHVIHLKKL